MLFNQSRAPPLPSTIAWTQGSKVKAHTDGRTSPDPVTGNTEVIGSDRVVLKVKLLPQSSPVWLQSPQELGLMLAASHKLLKCALYFLEQ